MGRMKVELKKIENKTYRHITFAKRKSGLVKKAHELSILCDVEIALIIFSPAGKLILFDAKKRMEEILEHYLDLPTQQRGRLHNEELIQRMVAQMNLEASIHKHYFKSSGNIIYSEPVLEDIQSQILSCTSELEDLERQIMCYVGNPSCIKTMEEAEYQEKILEKTLKYIRIHKQRLEANNSCIQLASEFDQQENVNAGTDLMRSSSHISNNPSHIDPRIPAMDFAGYNDGFQTFSNRQTLAGILPPPSPGMLHGYNFPSNNMTQSQFGLFGNTNITSGTNFNEQGSASTNAVQSFVGDPNASCYGTCSHHDYCGCRPPFPF